jgi:hypothetical protein
MQPETRWPGPQGGGTGPGTHTNNTTISTVSEVAQPQVLQFPIRSTVRSIIDLISHSRSPAVNQVPVGFIEDARVWAADMPAGDLRGLAGSFGRQPLVLSSIIDRGGG